MEKTPPQLNSPWLREAAGALGAGFLVLLFCLGLVARNPHFFWVDDNQMGYLPGVQEVASAWSNGELPLLNPHSWISGNLAGEYQLGTFSIFANLCCVAVWKLPLTLAGKAAAFSMANLFVLAAGTYLLARQRHLRAELALMVALVASLNGWIICWAATDWLSNLTSFAWLPWCWWALEIAVRPGASRGKVFLAAFFVYLLIAAGWPFTVLMLLLIFAWLLVREGFCKGRWQAIVPLSIAGACALGLAIPGLLMLVEHMQGSSRASVGAVLQWNWTVPLRALGGLILPTLITDWHGFAPESGPHLSIEMACGLVPVTALLGALIFDRKEFARSMRCELILLLMILAFCVAPSAGVFRWSFRWLPLFHLVLAILGAEALALLQRREAAKEDHARSWTRIWLKPGFFALTATLALGTFTVLTGSAYPQTCLLVCGELAAILMLWAIVESIPAWKSIHAAMPPFVVFATLFSLYFHIPTTLAIPIFNFDENLTSAGPLDPQRFYLGIYQQPEALYTADQTPPGFGAVLRPGVTGMYAGLNFINGYSAIVPRGVASVLKSCGHGEPDLEMTRKLIDSDFGPRGPLTLLGIDGFVVSRRLDGAAHIIEKQWPIVYQSDEATVLHRPGPLSPRARLRTDDGDDVKGSSLTNLRESRNRVIVDVETRDQPAILVFTRPWFSGYRAWLDGKPLAVERYRGVVPSIRLPAGSHGTLTLVFCPDSLIIGLCITSATALTMLLGSLRLRPARNLLPGFGELVGECATAQ